MFYVVSPCLWECVACFEVECRVRIEELSFESPCSLITDAQLCSWPPHDTSGHHHLLRQRLFCSCRRGRGHVKSALSEPNPKPYTLNPTPKALRPEPLNPEPLNPEPLRPASALWMARPFSVGVSGAKAGFQGLQGFSMPVPRSQHGLYCSVNSSSSSKP